MDGFTKIVCPVKTHLVHYLTYSLGFYELILPQGFWLQCWGLRLNYIRIFRLHCILDIRFRYQKYICLSAFCRELFQLPINHNLGQRFGFRSFQETGNTQFQRNFLVCQSQCFPSLCSNLIPALTQFLAHFHSLNRDDWSQKQYWDFEIFVDPLG